MTTDLTVLPARTLASFGPALTDPGWAVAQGYQPSTSQLDRWADWIVELATAAGVAINPAAGSFREALTRLGYGNPLYQRECDHFEKRAAGTPDTTWLMVSGAWTLISGLGGQIAAAQDSGVECLMRSQGYSIYRAALPLVHCRVQWTDIQAASPVWRCGAIDSATQEGFGIEFHKATNDHFRVWTMTAGVRTYAVTDIEPVASTWYVVSMRLTGAPAAQNTVLAINGVVKATETTPIGHAAMARYTSLGSGAIAGKYVLLDWLGVEQDVSQADT